VVKKFKIRDLSRPLDLEAGDDLAALDEAATASPRAAAIVASSLVEDALRCCLCGFFTPVVDEAEMFDKEGAPLASFHAKIVMGYALGIYGEVTREDLRRIKLIRNAFAHSPRAITFETPEVKEKCLALSYVDMSRVQTAVTLRPYSDPRGKFLDTARLLLIDLHAIGSRKSEYEEVVGEMP
jgi:hypothetical protein